MKTNVNRVKNQVSKLIILSLLAIYATFSVGILKATHLCMGRVASVSFFTSEAKKCGCALFASDKSGCCEEDHDLVKIENDQKTHFTFQVPLPERALVEVLDLAAWESSPYASQSVTHAPAGDSPPPVPLFKIHCSLVFYDAEMIG